MRTCKKLLALSLCLILIVSSTSIGFAADKSGEKSVKGTTDIAKVPVGILVLEYADKDVTINNNNAEDVVKYMLQTVSDENGSYSIYITGLETQKQYRARIIENNTVEKTIDFYCPSTSERLEVYETIASLDKELLTVYENLASIIESNQHILGWSLTVYNTLEDKEKTACEIIDLCESNTTGSSLELAFDDLMETLKTQQTELNEKKAAALAAVNTKAWDNIRDVLQGDQDCLKGLNSNGYGLLYEFDSDNYLSLHKEYQTEVCQELAKTTYTDLKEFVEAANQAVKEKIKEAEEEKYKGSGGSSGGGTKIATFGSGGANVGTQENNQKVIFTDLESAEWAKESINALYAKGIISGIGENKFAPNNLVTREQFLKMLILASDMLDDGATVKFDDISESDWSYPYVASAYKAGITTGINEKEFGKALTLSRQDAATFASRVLKYLSIEPNVVNTKAEFTDSADIAAYARKSVELLQVSGVINGMDDGRFAPAEPLTRAQAAKIIYGLVKIIDAK